MFSLCDAHDVRFIPQYNRSQPSAKLFFSLAERFDGVFPLRIDRHPCKRALQYPGRHCLIDIRISRLCFDLEKRETVLLLLLFVAGTCTSGVDAIKVIALTPILDAITCLWWIISGSTVSECIIGGRSINIERKKCFSYKVKVEKCLGVSVRQIVVVLEGKIKLQMFLAIKFLFCQKIMESF